MAYNEFSYPSVLGLLGLTLREGALFEAAQMQAVPPDFVARLAEGVMLAQAVNTEKARSEWIIAPVLLEIWRTAPQPFGLFSGAELKAGKDARLSGVCDFLLTREPIQTVIRTPIVTVVEAKNENLRAGLGQCIAEMVAAQWMNETQGEANVTIYGVVTTGSLWQFARLQETTVQLEAREYTLGDLGKIFAYFRQFVINSM